jgi:signal transduction histidine kinase/DNA-binding response OmpR family regulator
LSHTLTWSIYKDSFGRIWAGAGNTIDLWDPASRSFIHYNNPGFSDCARAYILGQDRKGRLWVRTETGKLGVLDTATGMFNTFDLSQGLCNTLGDMENLEDGSVLLSGWAGWNIVWPDSIGRQRSPPPLLITNMKVNDRAVVPAPVLLGGTESLQLSHTQDVLEFEFAAIDIDAPQLVRYSYRLEGLEPDWVKTQDRRYVRYAAVPPGRYVFRLRAASARNEWPEQEIAFAVSIAPPWWKTLWSYAAYAFLFLGLLYAGYRVRLRQLRLEQQVELGQFKAEHLAEVDRLKSRFFANISHEFRTPLTLILGPIRKWRERAQEEELEKDMGMAERNANRLLRLINQLLDLSKLEAGAMKLRASRMNIVPLVKGIAYSFESSAGMRGVALNVSVDEEDIEVYCDKDMVEKILSNLLSNAFKFTPQGGSVTVSVALPQIRNQISDISNQNSIWITVADTGMGIPPDQLDKVFDRFYQVDASQTREHEGSGLGLALVKELVELHHGTIQVESEVGEGTTFTVRLPMGRSHLKEDEIIEDPVSIGETRREVKGTFIGTPGEVGPGGTQAGGAGIEKPIVLIVEDNSDVRVYITGYLAPSYQVVEAKDGGEGIEKARECVPDLVISDVMMPKKDGYEVCRVLKLDERTSHIPIILLTAKAASENRVEGLETGADDYLIKPFDPKELLARIRNLIDMRRKLRERFKVSVPLRPGEISVTSMDDSFLKKVMAVVEQHLGDEQFNIEELSALVNMSRVQLHRKLTALTSQPPGAFIRYLRLHRAMELLQKGAGTVSEIAYQVGFSDHSYFSKCFREQFGMVPTDVRNSSK